MSENTTTSYEEGDFPLDAPDAKVSVKDVFGIDMEMEVPAFSQANDYVPAKDDAYRFDRDTTLAILAGFAHNRRVMIQGYHGTGKSKTTEILLFFLVGQAEAIDTWPSHQATASASKS